MKRAVKAINPKRKTVSARISASQLLAQVDEAEEPGDDHRHDGGEDHADDGGERHFSEPTWVTMMLPSRLTLRPERAAAVANSPSTMTETKIVPTMTPGRLSGRMMVRKMREALAP